MIVDVVGAIVIIGILFLGFPLLILWLKDRGGWTGSLIKRTLGAVSLSFGLIITGWIMYNIFYPTDGFKEKFVTVFQLSVPLCLIGVGWYWLTSKTGISQTDVYQDVCDYEWQEEILEGTPDSTLNAGSGTSEDGESAGD